MITIIEWYASQPEAIKIAVISAAAVMATVLGSVIVAQLTNISIAKQRRAAEARTIKQKNYHNFFDAFWRKHASFKTTPLDTQGQLEASLSLCLETGRLPLYASKEFTELIAHSMKGSPEAAEVTIASMYEVMRKDLVSDNYKAFKNLQFNSIMLPNPVVPIDTK